MSDTPRTDAAVHPSKLLRRPDGTFREAVDAVFSRQLERELAEAKKDSRRYRWLRDNTCKSSLYEHCGIEGYDTEVMISGEVLDAAIDAAMKEGGK